MIKTTTNNNINYKYNDMFTCPEYTINRSLKFCSAQIHIPVTGTAQRLSVVCV